MEKFDVEEKDREHNYLTSQEAQRRRERGR